MGSTTARGGAAGAVGVLAMDVVTWWMYARESDADRSREAAARAYGKDTAHALVQKVARGLGRRVRTEQPSGAGILVHYALGMVPGMLYAHLREDHPRLRTGRGALYGLGLFLVNDELAAPLLGIAGLPGEYPLQAHLRGLVGHVVLGVVTEVALNALED